MSNYRTPDVYVEEVSTLPPSVAGVSTAVPAFIGYTAQATKDGKSVANTAVRMTTFLEYKEIFGGPPSSTFTVDVAGTMEVEKTSDDTHQLYYAMDLFFKNGGSDCYVISIGEYTKEDGTENYDKQGFLDGLDVLSKEDEPTLIVLGEATNLPTADYYEVCQAALAQCASMKDRFCIFDVLAGDDEAEGFRDGIGANDLKYGAAYMPHLQTSINYQYAESEVEVTGVTGAASGDFTGESLNGIKVTYSGSASDSPQVVIEAGDDDVTPTFIVAGTTLTISNVGSSGTGASDIVSAWGNHEPKRPFNIEQAGAGSATIDTSTAITLVRENDSVGETLETIKASNTNLYSLIQKEMVKQRVILPASSGVAGLYSKTDREQGVWKAPANVSLSAVIQPTLKITPNDQERLNIDENAGKSVNAIRSFVGKGTLVWGARTLAGNDNEWRYVPVRRLFNMIEESTKKASYFAVFEPNDATTWLKVKAMIDSFLYGLWQQGALAGSSEDQAYFVNVGLGKTMTQQDILEGRMIVEIGIAAVRPAEFIILRFSHKLQEA